MVHTPRSAVIVTDVQTFLKVFPFAVAIEVMSVEEAHSLYRNVDILFFDGAI
jgi:hypothetical protein